MSIVVADYSFSHPTPEQLLKAGVHAVGRYFGQGAPPKNLTAAEAKLLTAAGISIVSLFEAEADQAARGAAQGLADVALARKQRDEFGMPHDRPWFFAVDFDIEDYAPDSKDPLAKLGPVGKYFQAIHETAGTNTGAYGGYYLISRLFDAGLITWGFQTAAWSGGLRDHRAQLYQGGATGIDNEVDLDTPERADFGQWKVGQVIAPPKPAPPAPVAPEEAFVVYKGSIGGFAGRAVTSTDGGKTYH